MTTCYPENSALGIFQDDGITCVIVRRDLSTEWFLNGYVVIQDGRNLGLSPHYDDPMYDNVAVHGGVTYGDERPNGTIVLGFDTGHSHSAPIAHDYEAVRRETQALADQINKLTKG